MFLLYYLFLFLRCDGIFNGDFIATILMSAPMTKMKISQHLVVLKLLNFVAYFSRPPDISRTVSEIQLGMHDEIFHWKFHGNFDAFQDPFFEIFREIFNFHYKVT